MNRASQPHSQSLKIPPVTVLGIAVAFGLLAAIVVTAIAARQPWLGLGLSAHPEGGAEVRRAEGPAAAIPAGTRIVAVGSGTERIEFEALDFVAEPDGAMGDYGTYRRFLERQDRLARFQAGGTLRFVARDGQTFNVEPRVSGRPLTALPVEFWVQVVVGLVAWLIASAVFAFRSGEASARYLLLSGAATLTFAPLAGIYSTRELGLPAPLFQWINDLNFLGGSLFAASFLGLLLNYPRAIGPRWLGAAVVALFIGWFALQQVGVFASMTFARRFLVLIAVLVTFGLAGVQWFRTRTDPVARAALQWFLLSWLLGSSLFALFILLPQMFGVDTSGLQGYAFLLFLLVYGGLGFGILRFRLFDLGEWWGRIVIWTVAILLLVALDLLFLLGLQLSSKLSLSLALLISGLIWLPLRALVWERLLRRTPVSQEALFREAVDVALAPANGSQYERWERLLRGTFDPLHVQPAADVSAPALDRDGLAMVIPAVGALPSLRLEYARSGRTLFTPRDAGLARALTAMLRHAMESRTAYEKGVAQERARIARDIHDNIGAQLLGALHSREDGRKDTMIREALADLRDIINDASNPGHVLDEVLAGLRLETAERLSAAGIELRWEVAAAGAPALATPLMHLLRSIAREAVTNAIKHSGAHAVTIAFRCDGERMRIQIEDDGRGFDATHLSAGHGLANIRERVASLRGDVQLRSKPGSGTTLAVELPLHSPGDAP